MWAPRAPPISIIAVNTCCRCCVFSQAAAGGDVSVVGQSDDCDESEMVDDEVEVRAVALFQFILQCIVILLICLPCLFLFPVLLTQLFLNVAW